MVEGIKIILLKQDKYILDILAQFDMSDCKLVSTPKSFLELSSQNNESIIPTEQLDMQDVPYATIVGKFMYLVTSIRLDLAYVVSFCA